MKKPRRIAIIVGSENDLKSQCSMGLALLATMVAQGEVEVVAVEVASIHRNTRYVLQLVESLAGKVDVIITGAGWANHLSGVVDAYIRYTLRVSNVRVIGVAFEDFLNPAHTAAAILSMSEVPGTGLVCQDSLGFFTGRDGFVRACNYAVRGDFPGRELPQPRQTQSRTFEQALEFVRAAQGEAA